MCFSAFHVRLFIHSFYRFISSFVYSLDSKLAVAISTITHSVMCMATIVHNAAKCSSSYNNKIESTGNLYPFATIISVQNSLRCCLFSTVLMASFHPQFESESLTFFHFNLSLPFHPKKTFTKLNICYSQGRDFDCRTFELPKQMKKKEKPKEKQTHSILCYFHCNFCAIVVYFNF